MRIHVFQHVPFEGPGLIRHWAEVRGHTLSCTSFYDSPTLPDTASYDALVVMGGPMGVYDETEHPWLAAEKQYMRQAIEAGKYVLGICLGAQLIAASLGTRVVPHTLKEIGWFPVSVTGHPLLAGIEPTMEVFHWHGDRFDIPEAALHLMHSTACDDQAFLYKDRVLGLQFHLEMDTAGVDAILDACGHELTQGEWIQPAEVIRQKTATARTQPALYQLLDNWIGLPAKNSVYAS